MATEQQTRAVRRNVRRAQASAGSTRTLALSESARRELGRQGARARSRGGDAGHLLEDRNRTQLYEVPRRLAIKGRSNMDKHELIDAMRKSR